MGMVRRENGDRGVGGARGEPVAPLAILATTAYAEHGEALRGYLAGFTRDREEAEDLLHEAFVRLLLELSAGRPPDHLRAWLFRVGANLATSRARHQGVVKRRSGELLRQQVVPSPEDELVERESARVLTGRLAHLPEHVRAALVLSAHGYTGAEIARHIGRSELATRSLMCRHRARLRATFVAA